MLRLFVAASLLMMVGCTTTAVLHETTAVAVSAAPPAAPPPEPEPEPEPEPPPRVQVEAERIRVDEKIQFEIGSAEISASSSGLIQEIAQVMNANAHITRIRIEGHTDNQGAAAYNLRLSNERARAVVAALVERGVDAGRLQPIGFGLTRPIEDNETNAGRTANRRVEFNILEQGEAPAPAETPAPAPAEGGGQ